MIRPGDIVRLAGPPPLTAEVLRTSREGATRGHLVVEPVCGNAQRTWGRAGRDVLVRDVETHWRRTGR